MEDTPRLVRLPDGRTLAVDDVGDPGGVPVIYLHGTPDSRLARHPDDALAAACGVRLVAVDRPGAGDSDPHHDSTLASLGVDLGAVLDELAIDESALLGWSAGGLFALAAAGALGERVRAVGLLAPVPPVEAYADPEVLAALGPARRHFVELAQEIPPLDLALELAPYLVPHPLTPELALDHVLELAGEAGRGELSEVPGATERLARALVASVQSGEGGLVHDLTLQLEPGLDLTALRCPVRTIHGAEDGVSPPAVGAWLAARLPRATVEVVPGGAHHFLFPRWAEVLRTIARDARE